MKPVICAVCALLLVGPATLADDWLSFRGPGSAGVSADKGVPTEWSETKNLKWKLDLPGKGYSSPIVVGDSVFVTCYSPDRDLTNLKRYLVRVNRQTGKVTWSKEVPADAPEKEIPQFAGRPGFASHTPVSDGEHIFTFFGNSGVHVFDMQGEIVWKKAVGAEERARFGSGSSPILHRNMLIVLAGSESETIYAFDKATGKELWKTPAASLAKSYSTPVIATADGKDELLVPVVGEVWSLNPATGKLNWYCEARTDTALCPVILSQDGIAYCVGGRGGGRTAIRLGGKDDVTKTHTEWSAGGGSYVPSPVISGGHMYWVKDNGNASCVNLKTGKVAGEKRLGGKFYASITLIGGKLYALSRFDGMHILEATPEMKKLGQNKPLDDTDHSACPAVSDGQLFIRSEAALYCIAAE